jgi:transcriptional regulator CtsR
VLCGAIFLANKVIQTSFVDNYMRFLPKNVLFVPLYCSYFLFTRFFLLKGFFWRQEYRRGWGGYAFLFSISTTGF